MAGTKKGGQKAAATNLLRYGPNFYREVGKLGGEVSRGGGFAKDPVLAREAGRRGGLASKRKKQGY